MGRTKASVFPSAVHRLPRSLIEQPPRRGLKNTAESTAGIIPGNRGKENGSGFRRPLHSAQAVWPACLTRSSDRSRVQLGSTKSGVERRGVIRNHARAELGPRDVSTRAPTQCPKGFGCSCADQNAVASSDGPTPPKGPLRLRNGRERTARRRGASGPCKVRETSSMGRREKPRPPAARAKAT